MKRIRRIMAACDLSEHSQQSLTYAAELAENLNAYLLIVNIINQRDVVAVAEALSQMEIIKKGSSLSIDAYIDGLRKARSQSIQKLIKEIPCDHLELKIIIKVGFPYEKLIETIKEEHADMLVMGAKGRTNLADVLFGSTAEKMFRHCPVPLLSIREKKDE